MLPWQHFYQGALGQKFQFFVKITFFSCKTYSYRIFLARIRNQCLRIDPCAKFQLHWTKDKGTRILTWNDTKNSLMTSYLPPGDDVSKFFKAFEGFCPRVPSCQFGCNWTTNKRETEGPTAYMVPKDPYLNGVEDFCSDLQASPLRMFDYKVPPLPPGQYQET